MSDLPSSDDQEKKDATSPGAETERFKEFEQQHLKKNGVTPSPESAAHVSIKASKCPKCTSSIADHTQKIREDLQKLAKVTEELHEVHAREREVFRQEAAAKPFWERMRDFPSEPGFLQDMKSVLPFLLGLFALAVILKTTTSGLTFLVGSLAGAYAVFFSFKKWNLKKYATVDIYPTALVLGMMIILGSASFNSGTFWPELSVSSPASSVQVKVQSPSANIRQAPTTSATVVAKVSRGDQLRVLEQSGAWYKVETDSGVTGWVFSKLVVRL